MELDLVDVLSIRDYRLELAYSAARLNALDETRGLAGEFAEAAARFEMLDQEEGRYEISKVETQAMVETADDAWDATIEAFHRRLLDLCDNNADHTLYRRYFAEIPSHVTSMSYHAEILISRDLESQLDNDDNPELSRFADRLRDKRIPLEAALRERTRLEVEMAKFANRVALAKALANKLRRITAANLDEVARTTDRDGDWGARFFRGQNKLLDLIDGDGVDNVPAAINSDDGVEMTEGSI